MRTIILILVIAVLALIAAVASGLINVNQTREARVPELSANGNGVTAANGQTPAFEVETGQVAVGTRDKNVTVKVPTIEIKSGNSSSNASSNSQ
jgi:hypothetical protein